MDFFRKHWPIVTILIAYAAIDVGARLFWGCSFYDFIETSGCNLQPVSRDYISS
jgi:hypothetical protein